MATVLVQSQAQTLTSDYIDSLVQHSMELTPHAGMSVAVIQGGEVIHSKGYGIRSVETKEAVNAETLFCIASNSKAFTTTALAMLVDEGKLNWTDKVVDIIPEFKMYDEYVTREFTVVDLLTHRSGLGLGAGDLMFFPDGSDFTIDDVIHSFQYQKPVSSFRTKYDYDNLLYMVAGEVIRRKSGLVWDEFVQERIMKPLGMKHSAGLYPNLKNTDNVAAPHKIEGEELITFDPYVKPGGGFGAAGGIYSSVADLIPWVQMHLNEGVYGDSTVLISHKSHDALWTAQTNMFFDATPEGPYKQHYSSYGLGFQLFDQGGYSIVQHSGGLPGMLSMVTMIPEMDAAIIVLTNCAPGGYSFLSITNEIKDVLIDVDGRDWIEAASNYVSANSFKSNAVVDSVWAQVEANKIYEINYGEYTGTYKDKWFGDVVIEVKDGKLWFTCVRSPKLNGQMQFYEDKTFAIKWEYQDMDCDAFATFSFEDSPVAQGIKMKGISPDIDFSFDFHDLDLRRVQDLK